MKYLIFLLSIFADIIILAVVFILFRDNSDNTPIICFICIFLFWHLFISDLSPLKIYRKSFIKKYFDNWKKINNKNGRT